MNRIVDEVTIFVKGGDGGKGCDSHIRRSDRKLLPTGGDGGSGGNVIMRADRNITSLKPFLYQKHFVAESGAPGGSNRKKGKKGNDLLVRVPCGTMVYRKEKHFLIRDLVHPGEEVILVAGGRGGTGNAGGKQAQLGAEGESAEITLSLKIPAEVFIVGLPNSGKSKFLNRISHSHSKEEPYPFSTREPVLGTYETENFDQIRICELPGLYRDSIYGRGAGVDFLKHLERAELLLLMVDPVSGFASSLEEACGLLLDLLNRYQTSFLEIPRVVVVNKMDLMEARERVEREKFRFPDPIFLISAQTGEGIEPLMTYVVQKVRRTPHPDQRGKEGG